ncbi:MAG: aminodeoxychorismate synthase, component I [Gammaproteobacteria bacterium]|nr:MAG: aminodeoxychorismate synthase, component I [Gammaproteobacteria bacterium]
MSQIILPPLHHELPYHRDSSLYFEAIRQKEWPIFLDSAQVSPETGRYDIQAAAPYITLTTVGKNTLITQAGDSELSDDDPFSLLQAILKENTPAQTSDLPFCGGALGYFAYDLGRLIESIPCQSLDAEHIPDMIMGVYDWAIVTDHQLQRCWLASYAMNPDTHNEWDDLVSLLSNINSEKEPTSFKVTGDLTCNLNRQQYQIAFDKIQHYIHEGDCYQVNLAKRFEITAEGDPWFAYQLLRQQNSAPFSCYFSTPHVSILSSSPERLLKVDDNYVETKPIKGTRPRDLTDPVRDKALADELQASEKDQAENLMIVDLLRNDIGKVCVPGSISVPKPFELESFATVHHLVSTITGTLAADHDAVSLIRACFPGGSITGAPKLRSMEIIEELEPNRRGIYCGSIAYIGFDGKMDSNITIRTLIYSDNSLRFWAGGGIVADSNVDDEFQEIDDKAAAIFKLLDQLK